MWWWGVGVGSRTHRPTDDEGSTTLRGKKKSAAWTRPESVHATTIAWPPPIQTTCYLEGHFVICGVVREVLVEDAGTVAERGLHGKPQHRRRYAALFRDTECRHDAIQRRRGRLRRKRGQWPPRAVVLQQRHRRRRAVVPVDRARCERRRRRRRRRRGPPTLPQQTTHDRRWCCPR